MTPEKLAELENSVTAAETAAADADGGDEALNKAVDDAKAALAKVKAPSQKSKYTEAEKAAHTLKSTAQRAKELGLDPAEILGVKSHLDVGDEDDDTPVTFGKLREIQKKDAQKSAIDMADGIADEDTRSTVKQYLSDRIKPSGNAEEDFRLALAAASAGKNKEVIAHVASIIPPKRTSSGGSMPAHVEEEFTPTAEEQYHMKHFGLSKEKVIAARKASAAKGN